MAAVGGSVLIETSKGDLVVDLYTEDCPKACENFLKLCKLKYYNQCSFHRVTKDFIAQCGDVDKQGGSSVWGLLSGGAGKSRFFADELDPQRRRRNKLSHNKRGVLSMANAGAKDTNTSQFFIQLGETHLDYLDLNHTIFGEVTEGLHVLEALNGVYVDEECRPLRKFCIHHTVVLEDPFPDPPGLARLVPETSPEPHADSDDGYASSGTDEGVDEIQWNALIRAREAKSREYMLMGLGDIADADLKPPQNVLFVCCLNPVTEDEDLELAFSRFGKITSCEILRTKDGTSLQYAFIEFVSVKSCEQAYLKMENVRIDDRRIHIDFSQSVPRVWNKWMAGEAADGKGGGKGDKGGKGGKGGGKGDKGAAAQRDSRGGGGGGGDAPEGSEMEKERSRDVQGQRDRAGEEADRSGDRSRDRDRTRGRRDDSHDRRRRGDSRERTDRGRRSDRRDVGRSDDRGYERPRRGGHDRDSSRDRYRESRGVDRRDRSRDRERVSARGGDRYREKERSRRRRRSSSSDRGQRR